MPWRERKACKLTLTRPKFPPVAALYAAAVPTQRSAACDALLSERNIELKTVCCNTLSTSNVSNQPEQGSSFRSRTSERAERLTKYTELCCKMSVSEVLITSRRRRSTGGSWPRTRRTHPREAAAQTGCRGATAASRRGRASRFQTPSRGRSECCPPWQPRQPRRSVASAGPTDQCGCHSLLGAGRVHRKVLFAWRCPPGSSLAFPRASHRTGPR